MSEPEPLVRFRNNFPAKNATDIKKAYAKMQGISSGNPKGGSTTQPMVQEAFRMGVMKTVPNAKLFDADDIAEIFNYMDTDGDGSISCRDFINKVRGELNRTRHYMAIFIFTKLDTKNAGHLTETDLREFFKNSLFPGILSGQVKPKDKAREWLEKAGVDRGGGRQKTITQEDLFDYYFERGRKFDDDDKFKENMLDEWLFKEDECNKFIRKKLKEEKAAKQAAEAAASGGAAAESPRDDMSDPSSPRSPRNVGGGDINNAFQGMSMGAPPAPAPPGFGAQPAAFGGPFGAQQQPAAFGTQPAAFAAQAPSFGWGEQQQQQPNAALASAAVDPMSPRTPGTAPGSGVPVFGGAPAAAPMTPHVAQSAPPGLGAVFGENGHGFGAPQNGFGAPQIAPTVAGTTLPAIAQPTDANPTSTDTTGTLGTMLPETSSGAAVGTMALFPSGVAPAQSEASPAVPAMANAAPTKLPEITQVASFPSATTTMETLSASNDVTAVAVSAPSVAIDNIPATVDNPLGSAEAQVGLGGASIQVNGNSGGGIPPGSGGPSRLASDNTSSVSSLKNAGNMRSGIGKTDQTSSTASLKNSSAMSRSALAKSEQTSSTASLKNPSDSASQSAATLPQVMDALHDSAPETPRRGSVGKGRRGSGQNYAELWTKMQGGQPESLTPPPSSSAAANGAASSSNHGSMHTPAAATALEPAPPSFQQTSKKAHSLRITRAKSPVMSDSNDSAGGGGGGAGGSSGCCVGCAELRRKLAKQDDMLNDIKEELEDQKSTIRGLELAMKEQMKAAANVRKKSFMVAHASPLIDGSSEPPSR